MPDDLNRAKCAEEKRRRRAAKAGASKYAKRNAPIAESDAEILKRHGITDGQVIRL